MSKGIYVVARNGRIRPRLRFGDDRISIAPIFAIRSKWPTVGNSGSNRPNPENRRILFEARGNRRSIPRFPSPLFDNDREPFPSVLLMEWFLWKFFTKIVLILLPRFLPSDSIIFHTLYWRSEWEVGTIVRINNFTIVIFANISWSVDFRANINYYNIIILIFGVYKFWSRFIYWVIQDRDTDGMKWSVCHFVSVSSSHSM